jgi:HSP20 family protein
MEGWKMTKDVTISKPGSRALGEKAKPAMGAYSLLALRDQMDRLFDDFVKDWRLPSLPRDVFGLAPFELPSWGAGDADVRFDVCETDDAIEVTAELPGIDEKDIEISIAEGMLTVKGEKKFEKETKDREYYLSERHYGSFSRTMRMPDSVDEDKAKARFDKGVLSIVLPKRAETKLKKRRIEISKA